MKIIKKIGCIFGNHNFKNYNGLVSCTKCNNIILWRYTRQGRVVVKDSWSYKEYILKGYSEEYLEPR